MVASFPVEGCKWVALLRANPHVLSQMRRSRYLSEDVQFARLSAMVASNPAGPFNFGQRHAALVSQRAPLLQLLRSSSGDAVLQLLPTLLTRRSAAHVQDLTVVALCIAHVDSMMENYSAFDAADVVSTLQAAERLGSFRIMRPPDTERLGVQILQRSSTELASDAVTLFIAGAVAGNDAAGASALATPPSLARTASTTGVVSGAPSERGYRLLLDMRDQALLQETELASLGRDKRRFVLESLLQHARVLGQNLTALERVVRAVLHYFFLGGRQHLLPHGGEEKEVASAAVGAPQPAEESKWCLCVVPYAINPVQISEVAESWERKLEQYCADLRSRRIAYPLVNAWSSYQARRLCDLIKQWHGRRGPALDRLRGRVQSYLGAVRDASPSDETLTALAGQLRQTDAQDGPVNADWLMHLGVFLAALFPDLVPAPDAALANRPWPRGGLDVFVGKPTLFLPAQDNPLSAVMGLYPPDAPPQAGEVLICDEHTSVDDIECLLHRCLHNARAAWGNARTYTLLQPERLSGRAYDQLPHLLNELLEGKAGVGRRAEDEAGDAVEKDDAGAAAAAAGPEEAPAGGRGASARVPFRLVLVCMETCSLSTALRARRLQGHANSASEEHWMRAWQRRFLVPSTGPGQLSEALADWPCLATPAEMRPFVRVYNGDAGTGKTHVIDNWRTRVREVLQGGLRHINPQAMSRRLLISDRPVGDVVDGLLAAPARRDARSEPFVWHIDITQTAERREEARHATRLAQVQEQRADARSGASLQRAVPPVSNWLFQLLVLGRLCNPVTGEGYSLREGDAFLIETPSDVPGHPPNMCCRFIPAPIHTQVTIVSNPFDLTCSEAQLVLRWLRAYQALHVEEFAAAVTEQKQDAVYEALERIIRLCRGPDAHLDLLSVLRGTEEEKGIFDPQARDFPPVAPDEGARLLEECRVPMLEGAGMQLVRAVPTEAEHGRLVMVSAIRFLHRVRAPKHCMDGWMRG